MNTEITSPQAGKPETSIIFESAFEGHSFRATGAPESPRFVAKDACDALGHSNHRMAVQSLDEDEVSTAYVIDALGRAQETLVVTESGLYALIFQSRKPEAKRFRKWVTSEVLPTIRKTGAYSLAAANNPRVRRLELRLAAEKLIAQARAMQAEARTIFLTARRSALENNPEGWLTLKAFLASKDVWSASWQYPSFCTRMGRSLMAAEHGTAWVWGARNQVRSLLKTYSPAILGMAWDSVNGGLRIVAESGTARAKDPISKAEINGMFKILSDRCKGASN